MAVAVDQGHGFKPFTRSPRCRLQSFTQLDYQALDFGQSDIAQSLEHAFEFSNIHKSFSTPCLSQFSRVLDDHDTNSRIDIIVGHAEPKIRALAAEVTLAMASGVNPEPASNGLGGAYFLHAKNGDTIAVAKPIDEEPLALNNPKGLAGRKLGQPGIKCSIKIGETGLRESAAYFLDHDGFAGVPPTGLVRFSDVKFNLNNLGSDSTTPACKIASLQRFVNHDSDAGDIGPSSFLVTSVHCIGILDVRLMNLDRHAGNILVKRRKDGDAMRPAELVPIDHGFCLPESLDDPYFEWLHWPQASIPFSETEMNYISCLDPYKDAEILRTELPSIRESSIRVLVLCTIFLKQAAANGFCLAEIGTMMTRELCGGKENVSTLEKLCIKAKNGSTNNLSDDDNHQLDEVNIYEYEDDFSDAYDIPDSFQISPAKGKPSKIPRIFPMTSLDDSASISLNKNEHYSFDDHAFNIWLDNSANLEDTMDDNPKVGIYTRSQSFPTQNCNREGPCMSFGEMNDEEWLSFLDRFQTLLPEAFERKKFTYFPKWQSMRSSCDF